MNQQDREEFIILKEDVRHTKEDVRQIKKDVSNISTSMTKITSKLFKDEETGEEGYFEVTRKNAARLTKLENVKIALLVIYGSIWAFIGAYVKSKF